jgi:hypothetical protein
MLVILSYPLKIAKKLFLFAVLPASSKAKMPSLFLPVELSEPAFVFSNVGSTCRRNRGKKKTLLLKEVFLWG